MKCDRCNAETRVLETREREEFYTVRRHACANGHRFSTVQMLHTVVHQQRTWLTTARRRALAGVTQRRARFAVRERIAQGLSQPHKEETLAADVGCSPRLVRIVKRLVREGKAL